MKSTIWIETDQGKIELHLTTRSRLSREKRDQLIKTASSGKNEAAGTFLGMLIRLVHHPNGHGKTPEP